jgi:hypothetical protein
MLIAAYTSSAHATPFANAAKVILGEANGMHGQVTMVEWFRVPPANSKTQI